MQQATTCVVRKCARIPFFNDEKSSHPHRKNLKYSKLKIECMASCRWPVLRIDEAMLVGLQKCHDETLVDEQIFIFLFSVKIHQTQFI